MLRIAARLSNPLVKFTACALVICLALAVPAPAQAPALPDVYEQIRAEETSNSKVMWILHQLSDVYGHRVTASPSIKAASDWAVKTLASWGLANAHLEPFTFQPPSAAKPVGGWENLELAADAVKPFRGQLMVKPVAWTPSTKGVVTADVVILTPPGLARPAAGLGRGAQREAPAAPASALPSPMPPRAQEERPPQPTREELDAYLNSMKGKIRGKVVFVGKHVEVASNFNPAPLRRGDDYWKAQFDPVNPAPSQFGGGRGGQQPALQPGQLSTTQVARIVDQFLLDNGAAVRVNDAGRAHGIIVVGANSTYDSTRVVPTLVMRNEDYGRIYRLVTGGTPVTLRVNIQNKEYPETTAYNIIAEIPGTDKADEIVMLGAHFDSWHGASGTNDNAAGSAMMMEAARILSAIKVKPRRTIRIALWSGEEQGLLGSIAYVAQHFGSAENPKPEFHKFTAYFNIDSGTSKPRGASVFGPPAAAAMIREAMAPYSAWGFMGVRNSNSRGLGGTDHTSFNNAGLPGIGLSQDPFDYSSHTHHTNLDTYERVYEPDVREGAVMIASAVYAVAMADSQVARFTAAEMPAPVPVPAPGSTAVPAERAATPATQPAPAKRGTGNSQRNK